MGTMVKRHTPSKQGKRRSHHALKPVQVQKAENGKGYRLPHHKQVKEL